MEKTICAISTATGTGGIGIVRMSGENCFEILEKIFQPKNKKINILENNDESNNINKIEKNNENNQIENTEKNNENNQTENTEKNNKNNQINKLEKNIENNKINKTENNQIKGYTIKYGKIIDNYNNDEIIDEVLVSYFVSPKSYTKENMCEINTHGGMVVEQKILELCLKNGADLAEPGEFTKRAFLNGRIDLSQAEAVIDLINAKTKSEAKESINQLEGRLSQKIEKIEQDILNTITAIEVNIDYPEYDIEEISNRDAKTELEEISDELEKLENSFEKGKIIKDGIKTVIIGKPNAGKSTLLNTLLKEDRAIVSNIEGTTRDTIEEQLNVNGILLNIVDTAGIRQTKNEIEKIGVEKAKKLANEANLIIAIFDLSSEFDEKDQEIVNIIQNKNVIILLNKSDKVVENSELEKKIKTIEARKIKISAEKEDGIDELYKTIEEMFKLNEIQNNGDILITNERHKNQIKKARENINNSINALEQKLPVDIVSISIKQGLEDLGEITGKNVTEDIINEIFKNFCLGK